MRRNMATPEKISFENIIRTENLSNLNFIVPNCDMIIPKKKVVWVACFESYPKDKNTFLVNNQIRVILNVNAWHRFWFSVFFGAKWRKEIRRF